MQKLPDPALTVIFAEYCAYAAVPAFYEGYYAHGEEYANPYCRRAVEEA